MAPNDKPIMATEIKIVRNPSSPTPVIYVNQANVYASNLEVRLTFMDMTPPPPTSDNQSVLYAQEKLSLVMSPEFAKHLMGQLEQTMGNFEENFGKLRTLSTANLKQRVLGED